MVAYHDTYFSVKVASPGRVVIVVTQLDDRYFRGLQGQYGFRLSFRVHRAGHEDYLVRSQLHQRLRRSVSVELDLEEGQYDARVKLDAYRNHQYLRVEEVIRNNATNNRDKLTSIGLSYDLAHRKGRMVKTAEEEAAKNAYESMMERQKREKLRRQIVEEKKTEYHLMLKAFERERTRMSNRRGRRRARLAGKEAGMARESEIAAAETADTSDHGEPTMESKYNMGERDNDRSAKDDQADGQANRIYCESESGDDESFDSMSVYSEQEMDIRVDASLKKLEQEQERADGRNGDSGGQPADKIEKDPWNAVAVIGLRVYHQPSDGRETDKNVVSVQVVRRSLYRGGDERAEEGSASKSMTRGLDVDDRAKDATLTGEVRDRKKSIMGDEQRR